MYWPLNLRKSIYPLERYIWVKIRILHETERAILVHHGKKTWIPKSTIRSIRLRGSRFEIYVRESSIA